MFSTVLEKVQSFFSPHFLFASFLPLFIAAGINALLLYATNAVFRQWVSTQPEPQSVTGMLQGGTFLFILAVAAFLYSTLITTQRELLEGKNWPGLLCRALTGVQTERLAELERRLDAMRRARRRFLRQEWQQQLVTARTAGANVFGPHRPYVPYDFRALNGKWMVGALIEPSELEPAFTHLDAAFRTLQAGSMRAVEGDQKWFLELLHYACALVEVEYIEAFNRRKGTFGEARVRPTAFGNVSEATAAYAYARYGMMTDIFWSRLQKVAQADSSGYYKVLENAKNQLDAVVSLFWLFALTAIGWTGYLAFVSPSLPLFALVAVGGPLLCATLYSLAVTSYRAFGDVVRAVVDLYRFDLLKALRIPAPAGPNAEKKTWGTLAHHIGYGDEAVLRYEHPS